MEANLTAGYNLIVIPENQTFITHIGDIIGFSRNTSGAVLRRITAGQDTGVYFMPGQNTSDFSMDLTTAHTLNVSFSIKLHSSIDVPAVLTVSCLKTAGLYPLTTNFVNAISSYRRFTFRSLVAVQNEVTQLSLIYDQYIEVNTARVIVAEVQRGTNLSCEWNIPNSSLKVRQSPYLKKYNTTEGGVFQYSALYGYIGYVIMKITAYNLVSRKSDTIILSVRQPIEGLKVNMCHSAFAFENAETCFISNAAHGTDVGCTWYFKQGDHTNKQMGKTISRVFTSVGKANFTLYCYNKISTSSAPYVVQVIPNPLSIDVPLKVPADVLVKITCQVSWPGGTPALFFEHQGVKGKRGSDIIANPILTLKASGYSNSSKGHVTLLKSFKRALYRRQKVTCKSDSYPDLNTVHMVKAIYSIGGISLTSDCPLKVEVGTKCAFHVQLLRGDNPTFTWTIREGDYDVLVSSDTGRNIVHRFVKTGVANITVNATNDVSSRVNTTHFFVYSTSTRGPHVTPSVPSNDISSYSTYATKAVMSIRPTSATSYSSTSETPHQILSLRDAALRHASVGFVGHAIAFSVEHVEQPHLFRFIWNWNDKTGLEDASSTLTHTFDDPGHYFITVNVSYGVGHVTLSGHVTIQYRINGLLIRDLAVISSNLLIVKFEILQGTNVTYSLEYGDDSGRFVFLIS